MKTPEEHAHIGTIDVVGGFCGALACVCSLFKRRRTGQADVARASLASAGNLLQVSLAYEFEGRVWNEPCGHAKGRHALYRWYHSKEGEHLFLASARNCDLNEVLKNVLTKFSSSSLSLSMEHADDEVAKVLQDIFKGSNMKTLLKELNEIPNLYAVKRRTLSSLRSQYSKSPTTTYDFDCIKDHPIGSSVTMFATNVSVRAMRGKIRRLSTAPKYGQDAEHVLVKMLGLVSSEELKGLVKRGAVVSSWSSRYIPSGDPWSLSKKEYMDYIAGTGDC